MDTILSIVVLVAVALVAGAIVLYRRGIRGKQISLMVLLAVIMIANVLIWTVPDATGVTPVEQAARSRAAD